LEEKTAEYHYKCENTGAYMCKEYKEGGFNHDTFYEWFSNLDYPAYMSEYETPFEKVEMFKHRSSLSATNNKKKVFESIFWNGKGKQSNYSLFQ